MKYYIVALLLTTVFSSFSQSKVEKARENANEAVRLMDNGQINQSIKLLIKSIKLDPANIDYPYEIGYALYLAKEYQKATEILAPLAQRNDVYDLVFQLLGNSYDMAGQREMAIQTYESGLIQFPKSGPLHLELGNMYLHTKEYSKAISYYEKGIEAQPNYSSNYFRLAKLFLSSDEEVWGMIYGEIFMNLERNSTRTSEISQLLFNTYKSEIQFTSDTSFTISFSKTSTINIDTDQIELPFGVGIYEPSLMIALLNEKSVDIHSLDRIRTKFLETYFAKKFNKKYPNVLFDYQYSIYQMGHLEAYNHWILMKGDEEAFSQWKLANTEKWDVFVKWFSANGLKIENNNTFIRTRY